MLILFSYRQNVSVFVFLPFDNFQYILWLLQYEYDIHKFSKMQYASSFPVWMPFISSSCLFLVARTSSAMLNKRVENRHPRLFPNLKRNDCNFCTLTMMLAVGLSHMAFIMLRNVTSTPTVLRVFIINECQILLNAFSASIDMIM